MEHPLKRIIHLQNKGIPVGICSVCSANRYVIEAAMDKALFHNALLVIEATANQVNQYGGYTGMKPIDFRNFVLDIAKSNDFPQDMIILGGDHIGPVVWRNDESQTAMSKSCELVRELIDAGFTKIHIDTSMRLVSDDRNKRLSTRYIAERGAVICKAAEDAFRVYKVNHPDAIAPVYIIGSEVPVPGGSLEHEDGISVTTAEDFEETLNSYKEAFDNANITNCWDNVIAVVVQPGVEFGNDFVLKYNREAAENLTKRLKLHKSIVFEGHSTDYQKPDSLKQMVEDGIAILKVGPALTFALREALFGLNMIEEKMYRNNNTISLSNFSRVLENVMVDHPVYWNSHYYGSEEQVILDMMFSFSDRCRYYLPSPEVLAATQKLIINLSLKEVPLTLLSQYMPVQYNKVRDNKLENNPKALIKDKIGEILKDYYFAVTPVL